MATPTGTMKARTTPISQMVPEQRRPGRRRSSATERGVVGEEVGVDRAGAVDGHVDQQRAEQAAIESARQREQEPARKARPADLGAACGAWPTARLRSSLVHLPVLAHEADRDQVHDQRDHEQRHADGEDRLVLRCCPWRCRPWRSAPMNEVIVYVRLARDRRSVLAIWPGGHEHDHRLADGARDAEHDRRDDPRERGREDDAQRRPGAWTRPGRTRPRAATGAPPTSRPRRPTRSSG